jgi:hypothetical protein
MHPPVASSAVEQEPAEFPFQFSFRLEELHPQALRGGSEPRLIPRIDCVGFLDKPVGVLRPIGDGVDRALEDFAVNDSCHAAR